MIRGIFSFIIVLTSFTLVVAEGSSSVCAALVDGRFDGIPVKFKTQYDNAGFVYLGVPWNQLAGNDGPVGMYTENGSAAIDWLLEEQEDGTYIIVLNASPSTTLEAGEKRLGKNGSKVQVSGKSGAVNQRWQLSEIEAGVFKLIAQVPEAEGRVLDVVADDRTGKSGTPVHLWTSHSGTNQSWVIETEQATPTVGTNKEAIDFAFDCNSPAVLFDGSEFRGRASYLDNSGDYLMNQAFFGSESEVKLTGIKSVGVNKGWHVSFPGEDGGQVVVEASQSGTMASMREGSVLKLARKLNIEENESDCNSYVYLKVDQNIRNNIIVSRVKMGKPEAEVIGTIASNIKGLWVAEAEMGDLLSFSFAKEELDYKIPSIEVADYTDKTYLVSPEIQWKDARTRYERIANAAANRFSFDATKIPPAYIDMPQEAGGGVRRQIFKDLGESDTDWTVVDGDIALKRQFVLTVLDFGEGSETSESVWSKEGFMESSSTNISASAQFPMPNVGAVNIIPSGSYGFSETTEKDWENNEVFTYSRINSHVYEIELKEEEADFTNEFINAIQALPRPQRATYSSLEDAKADPAWSQYAGDFIKNWGTHVPKKVTYGGFFMGVNTETFQDYNEKEISTTSLTAGIEADATVEVSAGVEGVGEVSKETGYKAEVGYSKSTEKQKTKGSGSNKYSYSFLYRGGQGSSFDSYSVGDNVQPVDISLSLISELFKDKYFSRKIPNLEAKGKLLAWAIYDYVDRNRK